MRDRSAAMPMFLAILAIFALPLVAGVMAKAAQNAAFEAVNADRYDETGVPRW